MISLINDDVTIVITEDNPVYKNLKRFHGESFLVYVNPQVNKKVVNKVEEKKESLPKKVLSRDGILKEFDSIFLGNDVDNNKIPIFISILRSDLESILGGDKGEVYFDVEKDGVYKRNNKYLITHIS